MEKKEVEKKNRCDIKAAALTSSDWLRAKSCRQDRLELSQTTRSRMLPPFAQRSTSVITAEEEGAEAEEDKQSHVKRAMLGKELGNTLETLVPSRQMEHF